MKKIASLMYCIMLAFLVSSCAINSKHEESGLSSLRATLSGEPSTDKLSNYNLTITLKNVGDEPALINTDLMLSPAYVGTYNMRGARLFVLPPSAYLMPNNYDKHTWRKILPGEEYSQNYLMTSFTDPPPPGRYLLKIDEIRSNSLMVDVTSK